MLVRQRITHWRNEQIISTHKILQRILQLGQEQEEDLISDKMIINQ